MTIQPEVTVVIPAYNSESTIRRAVDSALGQTFQDFEIVVVDDASTDRTASLASSLADPRIRIIRHDANRGEAGARNTGIGHSRGSYIAWLDADDEWLPEKLTLQVDALKGAGENIGGYCAGSWLVQSGEVRRHVPTQPRSWTRALLLGSDLGAGTTLLARRAVFDKVGPFDEQLARNADWDWLLRFVQQFDLGVLQRPLVRIYRGSPPAGTVVEKSTLYFLEKHADTFGMFGARYRRKAIAKRWLTIAWYYYYMTDRNLAKEREYFSKAVRTYQLQKPHAYLGLIDSIFGTRIWLALANRLRLRKYHR